jgi:adenine-specific DNA-methyltransferase
MIEAAREFRKTPTSSEATLWKSLRWKGLDGTKFRRQQPIGPFVVDFYAPLARLVVEVDGPIHLQQQDIDRERQQLIETLGIRFVRVSAEMVERDLGGALMLIREAIVAGAPPLSPALSPTRGERESDPTPTRRRREDNGTRRKSASTSGRGHSPSPLVGEGVRG